MKFSEFIQNRTQTQPDFIRDKRIGKAMARYLGINVAESFEPKYNIVAKSYSSHSGKDVVFLPSGYYIEEVLEDRDGGLVKGYSVFFFNEKPKVLQVYCDPIVDNRPQLKDRVVKEYLLDPYKEIQMTKRARGVFNCSQQRANKIIEVAQRVANQARLQFIRVDLYNTKKGIYWAEACITPGFALRGNITPEMDEMMGGWL